MNIQELLCLLILSGFTGPPEWLQGDAAELVYEGKEPINANFDELQWK